MCSNFLFSFLARPEINSVKWCLIHSNARVQLLGLKTRGSGAAINLNKENEGSWSNGSETSCEVNLKTSSTTDSRLYLNQQRNKHSSAAAAAIGTANLSSQLRPNHHQHHNLPVSNDCFGNMFGSIEESQEFWPWSDQQQNFH